MSDEEPKLIAIVEEANDQIVHRCRFGKANGATYEPFHPGLQIDVFALDFLCMLHMERPLTREYAGRMLRSREGTTLPYNAETQQAGGRLVPS